jgi:hypothetical protein
MGWYSHLGLGLIPTPTVTVTPEATAEKIFIPTTGVLQTEPKEVSPLTTSQLVEQAVLSPSSVLVPYKEGVSLEVQKLPAPSDPITEVVDKAVDGLVSAPKELFGETMDPVLLEKLLVSSGQMVSTELAVDKSTGVLVTKSETTPVSSVSTFQPIEATKPVVSETEKVVIDKDTGELMTNGGLTKVSETATFAPVTTTKPIVGDTKEVVVDKDTGELYDKDTGASFQSVDMYQKPALSTKPPVLPLVEPAKTAFAPSISFTPVSTFVRPEPAYVDEDFIYDEPDYGPVIMEKKPFPWLWVGLGGLALVLLLKR